MCTPIALGVGSLIASVAGFGMQAYSQSQAMNYQAQVARNNQIIAQQNANIALQQGQQAEETQRIKTGQMEANFLAMEGASGVNPNTGSPLNVRSSAAETGELDAETIRYNAQLKARNYMTQANSYGAQSSLYNSAAGWDIGNSILGGASSVSSKWLQYQQWGVPGFNPMSNQPEGIMG